MDMINKIENVTIGLGLYFGLANVQDILGFVILVVQFCLIVWKTGYAIYCKIKDKKFSQIEEDVKKGIQDLEDLKKEKENEQKN